MTGFTWGGGVDNGLNIPRGSSAFTGTTAGRPTAEGIQARDREVLQGRRLQGHPVSHEEGALRAHEGQEVPRAHAVPRRPGVPEEPLRHRPRDRARQGRATTSTTTSSATRGRSRRTTDAVDFCCGPHTLANFRKWLKKAVRHPRGPQRQVEDVLQEVGRRDASHDRRGEEGRQLRAVGRPPHLHGDNVRQRLPDGARRGHGGGPGRPHSAFPARRRRRR